MKRILLATAGVAVVAVFAATIGFAQPTATTGGGAARRSPRRCRSCRADIASRKRFIVGVKCDTPPFGYLDVRGKNAGVDVEIAKWFARYAFGREQRLTFVCAPTAVREPLPDRRPCRPRHLDVHLHRRPGHADRLLPRVLQGDRAVAREERFADPVAERHPGPEDRDDAGLDLRPLDEALLLDRRGARRRERHRRGDRLQPGPGGRGHVRRHVARAPGARPTRTRS